MKERPILFSGEMVKAILAGRKTMTRRVVKPQPKVVHAQHCDASITTERIFRSGDQRIHCPYGQPGDRLWVRETFVMVGPGDIGYGRNVDVAIPRYRADDPDLTVIGGWKPSIFMPRSASRITLEITGIGIQRLKSMNGEAAIREGIERTDDRTSDVTLVGRFSTLWESINGKRSWIANPWVWVVSFKRI